MEEFKILHIMGTKPNGEALEILVFDPDPENATEDYLHKGDSIDQIQIITFEGDWDYAPIGNVFERAY